MVVSLYCYMFQRLSHVVLGIGILFQKLTPEIGVEIEKHPLHKMPLVLGISCKVCILF